MKLNGNRFAELVRSFGGGRGERRCRSQTRHQQIGGSRQGLGARVGGGEAPPRRNHQDLEEEGAHRQGGARPVRGGPEERHLVAGRFGKDQHQGQPLQTSIDGTGMRIASFFSFRVCTLSFSAVDSQEGSAAQSVTRVRRFQRELEAAEDRAEVAESNLSLIRAKHRTFVTTSTVPGSQVYLVESSRTSVE